MARSGKQKKGQLKLLNEIRNQLVLQAERWGRKGHYTPLRLEEMEQEQCRKIVGNLLSEKANLEYELHLLDSDKHDLLIKMERLEGYIKKAAKVIKGHDRNISRVLQKMIGDKDKIKLMLKKMRPENSISILINSN